MTVTLAMLRVDARGLGEREPQLAHQPVEVVVAEAVLACAQLERLERAALAADAVQAVPADDPVGVVAVPLEELGDRRARADAGAVGRRRRLAEVRRLQEPPEVRVVDVGEALEAAP